MPRGISMHLGLNAVDPRSYEGWGGELQACEADAKDMAKIAKGAAFEERTLLTKEATRDALLKGIRAAAGTLRAGDIFLVSYSGHGGQVPDRNDDEPDGQDETWCLYDGELIDDELWHEWTGFPEGVRILVVSDSCHSGTVVRAMLRATHAGTEPLRATDGQVAKVRYRAMPSDVAERTYRAHRKMYDDIQDALGDPEKKRKTKDEIKASVILLSGCQDNQLSQDGTFNGLFTANLLRVWDDGKFEGDYKKFQRKILDHMPPDQTPNYFVAGQPNRTFERQKPFSVEAVRVKSLT